MIDYFGHYNDFDWAGLIKHLETQTPAYVGPSHKAGDPIPGLQEIIDMWDRAGYKTLAEGGNVGWDMFLPDVNFDRSVVDKFAQYVNKPDWKAAWVSRIHPGNMAPLHWDVQDNEEELNQQPDSPRYHVHMQPSTFGHILIVDGHLLYNRQQGDTYKWSSRKLWHAGANAGLVPKYIFNFW